jgi:RHS repeat-associated protein
VRKPRLWRPRHLRIRLSRRAIQRATTWVALLAQLSVGLPIGVLARAGDQQPSAGQPAKSSPPPSTPAVRVNRTVPKVTPVSARPVFSAQPTDAEITSARIFGEPLVAIGRGTLPGENRALADAVNRYIDAHNPERVLPFLGFLKTYPDSPWRASLLLNLGLVYRHTGYFLRALDVWEQTWAATKTGTGPNMRAVGDRALGEIFALNARLGRFEQLEALFAETKDRVVTGPATEQITAAREGLWMMRHTPEKAFLCGPLAVDQVLAASRADYVRDEKILQAKSTQQGTSLAQMQKLAADLNLPLQMAKRAPGAQVLLPAVMHWKAGHFAALIREAEGKYLVRDPTFGDELWVSRIALDEEASGYMLVKPQSWPEGWRPVEQSEGEQVWGKGQTDGNDPDDTQEDDPQAGGDGGDDDDSGGGNGDDDTPNDNGPNADNSGDEPASDPDSGNDGPKDNDPPKPPRCEKGMARYSVHLMLVSLHVKDAPVGYAPPRGPSMLFTASYSQREAHQPSVFTFSNLGPKWTMGWLSYIEDDPTNPSASAYLAARGGGRDTFTGFNSTTQAYQAESRHHAILVRTSSSPIHYERRLRDGSVEVFSQADGASTFPRRIFLTEIHDPRGNTVTFTYDGQLRLVAATDALGQVTTLSYNEPSDSRKITAVTDPFGRSATFTYDGAGRLASITDVIGLQSAFTYDGGDFITALTTPYGITRFVKGENGLDRWLETTDPLGAKERVEYKVNAPVPATDAADRVPVNVGVINNYLNYRNTFYWGKRAMALAPRDPASAHRYHWLHTAGPLNQTSGTLESEQRPLEGRVWYRYPGQSTAYTEGTSRRRTVVARVLDDGSTQAWRWEYNTSDHVTKTIDPIGRQFSYTYASNGIDLLEVRQTANSSNELLATYGSYTAQHRPQTATNAAAQTTTRTYNAYGQLLTVTNAKNETTTDVYDGDGYLQSVTGPIAGATTSFTYDGYGRIHTVTGPDGYARTRNYDPLDRLIRTTYPDGTYNQFVYDRLDLSERRDRLGRTTRTLRDALRRVVSVRDRLGRTATNQWCGCGSLDAIIDAKGQKTSWERDLQGRVIRAVRADNVTATAYTYEARTSRKKTVTDPKGQVTTYSYALDNLALSETHSNETTPTPAVSYTYDPHYKRVLTMVDGTGTTTNTYKAIGGLGAMQVASVDGPLTNDTFTFDYDDLGRVTSAAINGAARTSTFDALGRVVTEANALGTSTYTYDGATRRLATVTYPNGQIATFSYFPNVGDRRLQTILHQRADSSTISRFDYTYDTVGNIASWQQQVETDPAVRWQYEYDAANQLLAAIKRSTGGTPAVLKRFAYAYDAAGNRIVQQEDDQVTSTSYDALNRLVSQTGGGRLRIAGQVNEPATVSLDGAQVPVDATGRFTGTIGVASGTQQFTLTAVDASGNTTTAHYSIDTTGGPSRTFTYDSNNNLLADGLRTYTWDGANRLLAVADATGRSEFAYDGMSRRVLENTYVGTTLTSTRNFIWCGSGICEERDAAGTGVVRRLFAQGEARSGGNVFNTFDHLTNVREVLDGTGQVLGRVDYDPWGRVTATQGTQDMLRSYGGTIQLTGAAPLFTLYRAYDPGTGRWLSDDPAGLRAGLNLAAYVGNNPIRLIDPLGLDPTACPRCAYLMAVCADKGTACQEAMEEAVPDALEQCLLSRTPYQSTSRFKLCYAQTGECADMPKVCEQCSLWSTFKGAGGKLPLGDMYNWAVDKVKNWLK